MIIFENVCEINYYNHEYVYMLIYLDILLYFHSQISFLIFIVAMITIIDKNSSFVLVIIMMQPFNLNIMGTVGHEDKCSSLTRKVGCSYPGRASILCP